MIRHHRRQKFFAEINITPFTDVILVLLIIFMVAAPVIYQSNIKIKLPKAKSAQTSGTDSGLGESKVRNVVISVTSEGMIYMGEDLYTSRELKDKITQMHRENPDMNVYLRADQQTRFKDVVEVLDMLTAMGVAKLDIAAIKVK